MTILCRIEMLGGLKVQVGERALSRFRTQKTASLLAYLAFYATRSHPREELAERFWPDAPPGAGRNSLKQELASLRRQLEPPGLPTGSVLTADRTAIGLNPEYVAVDVRDFEAALRFAKRMASDVERSKGLQTALGSYRGPLLPGCYEEWVGVERVRLEEAFVDAALQLSALQEQAGDLTGAIDSALRAVAADPLREESHHQVIRLRLVANQNAAALQQYELLQHTLRTEMGMSPSLTTRSLVAGLLNTVAIPPRREIRREKPISPVTSPYAASVSTAPLSVPTSPRLPVQLTPLFGREEEITRIVGLLRPRPLAVPSLQDNQESSSEGTTSRPRTRLMTLTGTGGTGKTRLAIEAAGRLRDLFSEAVWFVPLAEVTEPIAFVEAIAEALSLPLPPTETPLLQVSARLAQQPCLLILDNFEQLAETDATMAALQLLELTPTLTCLITSRQRLNLSGEREFPVAPLAIPETTGLKPAELLSYAGVAMFVDRAQAARPDFQVTQRNAEAITALCRRLEGLPLAIELTAAWAQILTPTQMLERLAYRLDLAVGSRKDRPARHQTLHAAIAWSYHQLEPALQRFFTRLSVFRGGCSFEATQAVCPDQEALVCLAALRERSLITVEESQERMRYRLLETLREFGAEQITEEERNAAREAHTAFYLQWVITIEPLLLESNLGNWLNCLQQDYENLRAAREWLQASPNGADAELRLAGGLIRFWETRAYFTEGRAWLDSALARRAGMSPDVQAAKALNGLGGMAYAQDDYETARAYYERSLEMERALEHDCGIGHALHCLGNVAWRQGDHVAACAYFEASIAGKKRINDQRGIANSLHGLGDVACSMGQYAEAKTLLQQSLTIWQDAGDMRAIPYLLSSLGRVACCQGDYETAFLRFQESLEHRRRLGDRQGLISSLNDLGLTAWRKGEWDLALATFRECLELARELRLRSRIADSLEGLAALALEQGAPGRGAQLLGTAEALREATHAPRPAWMRPDYEPLSVVTRKRLGEAAFLRSWETGRTRSIDQAIEYALSLKA